MTRAPARRAFKRTPLMAKLSPVTARVIDADRSGCELLHDYLAIATGLHSSAASISRSRDRAKKSKKNPRSRVRSKPCAEVAVGLCPRVRINPEAVPTRRLCNSHEASTIYSEGILPISRQEAAGTSICAGASVMNQLPFKNHQDEIFAVLLSVVGLGIWVLLVYEWATHLKLPVQ